MRLNHSVVVLLAVLWSARAYAAPPQVVGMIPGLWQITVQTTSPASLAPVTHAICVDRALEMRADPPKTKSKDDCQVSLDPSVSNETAFTVRCAKARTSSSSRFKYLGDHVTGTVVMTNASGEIHQDYTATRIGDCEETQPAPPLPQTPQPPAQPA